MNLGSGFAAGLAQGQQFTRALLTPIAPVSK